VLSFLLSSGTWTEAFAQGAKKAETDAKPKDETPPQTKAPAKQISTVEVLKDPKAEEALPLEKVRGVVGWRKASDGDVSAVKAMASGEQPVDRDTIQRFVQGMGVQLTDKAAIDLWMNPTPEKNAKKVLDIHKATDNLIEVLNAAKSGKNTSFLKVYNEVLIANLPKLLKNHLLPRTEAIIVLAKTESPDAIKIFQDQLKDEEQTLWVKLCSAEGLSNIAGGGTRVDSVLGAQKAIEAGKSLADFLSGEENLYWPVVWRALQALGAMRQSGTTSAPQKAEMASAAMKFLADPEANPRVRATAAWALSMMRVNPQVSKYNYALIAHEIGSMAAEFGEKADEAIPVPPKKPKPAAKKDKDEPKAKPKAKAKKDEDQEADAPEEESNAAAPVANPTLAELYASLLAKELFEAFRGTEGARESGLLNASLGPAATVARQIADLQDAVAKAAVELVKAPPGQIEEKKKDLQDRVAALKAFLAKNPPKDFHLVPNGPEFRAPDEPVAEAPAASKPAPAKPKGSGGSSGDR
jgi:hypothetical protein